MSFDRITYLQKYLHNPSNDAAGYGVRVLEADVAQGESYWRIIGVHHLDPDENWGRHLVYIDVIDETGRRIQFPCAWADWTWEGRDEAVPTLPIALDGPEFEPAGQLPLADPSQPVSVWLKGLYADADDTSDRVENLHTGHPDELTSDGQLGNGIGHHSFYVVFQRTRKGEDSTSGADQEETILSFDAPTPEAEAEPSPHRRHKIGLDANRPIIIDHGPRLGAPADTVANPEMIAATGAAWVRINFVLGPWLGPNDQTRFQGLTWAETYEAIVDSFLDRGLNVYGLIGHESVRQSPDFFMDAPNDMPDNEISRARDWIAEYARSFREIVERFLRITSLTNIGAYTNPLSLTNTSVLTPIDGGRSIGGGLAPPAIGASFTASKAASGTCLSSRVILTHGRPCFRSRWAYHRSWGSTTRFWDMTRWQPCLSPSC